MHPAAAVAAPAFGVGDQLPEVWHGGEGEEESRDSTRTWNRPGIVAGGEQLQQQTNDGSAAVALRKGPLPGSAFLELPLPENGSS